MTPLYELSIAEAGKRLRHQTLSAVALTRDALARIRAIDPHLHTFVHVMEAHALEQAQRADRELAQGIDRGPMHGIPYAVKDIYDVSGVRTSCHSRLTSDHIASIDSTVVAKLREAGAVLLGKLATHEFALGGPSFDLPFPPARNPWDTDHFTGGSSSGSAAAVAAGLTRVALGSDSSGSIRSPAFYCGVVGLKPTYGLVSRHGVFPLSYALDHCGPLTWTVEDAAIVLQVIAGYDPRDLGSEAITLPDYRAAMAPDLSGLRIGVARHYWAECSGASPEVTRSLDAVAQTLCQLGASIEEVRLPDFELFEACGRILMTADAYAIHEAQLRTRGEDYGRYTFQRIAPGVGITAADLLHASRLRLHLTRQLNGGVLRTHHALLSPVGLSPAPRLDAFQTHWSPNPLMRTIAFTVTGNPALAVPAGSSSTGLPLGFQIVGRAFDERTVLRIGAAFQQAMGLPNRRPALASLPAGDADA